MNTRTTIAIDRMTRGALAKMGGKDSTFDSIIRQLLKKSGVSTHE